jgi:hypothetical protein
MAPTSSNVRFQSINGRLDVVHCEGYVAQSEPVGWRSLRSSLVDRFVKLGELQLGAAVGCLQHDHFDPDGVEADDRIHPVALHDLRSRPHANTTLAPAHTSRDEPTKG